MKTRLESLEDTNKILIKVKWFLLEKEMKTKFFYVAMSQFQIMNGENVHKSRKLTKLILIGMQTTRIKRVRDPYKFLRWRALQY